MTEETRMTTEILEHALGDSLRSFSITTVPNGFYFLGKFFRGIELIEIIASVPGVAARLAEPTKR